MPSALGKRLCGSGASAEGQFVGLWQPLVEDQKEIFITPSGMLAPSLYARGSSSKIPYPSLTPPRTSVFHLTGPKSSSQCVCQRPKIVQFLRTPLRKQACRLGVNPLSSPAYPTAGQDETFSSTVWWGGKQGSVGPMRWSDFAMRSLSLRTASRCCTGQS